MPDFHRYSGRFEYTLPGRVPSKKNSLRRIKRGNKIYTVSSEKHTAWAKEMHLRLMSQKNKLRQGKPIETVGELFIKIYFPDNRKADLTNKAESIMDAMVDAGILQDDDWHVVGVLHLVGAYDKEKPRAEVSIYGYWT